MTLFERREYLSRVDRTKERMAARGIDVLLVASPANQFYLTGYDGCSFYTPQMVVVSLAQEEPVWVGRAMDAAGAKFTAFLTPDNVVPYPDTYVGSGERHPMEFVADVVRQRGWDRGAIGVEMDDYYYTARWHEILTRDLPNARLVDAFLLVNWVRMVKSPREIEFLMQAGQIAAAAMQATIEAAQPGRASVRRDRRALSGDDGGHAGVWRHLHLQAAERDGRRILLGAPSQLDRRAVGRG